MDTDVIIPKLFIKSKGQDLRKLILRLTTAKKKFAIRLTGGCGNLSSEHAEGMYDFFNQALAGYEGALMFGGTRMIMRHDTDVVFPGITEIPYRLKESTCPSILTLGVIPRTEVLGIADFGLLVSDEKPKDGSEPKPYVTIVHPKQDIVLVTQVSADKAEIWDAEVDECHDILNSLKEDGEFGVAVIAYNGGGVTEREIRKTAASGWPMILINGSGGRCDLFSNDEAFLQSHPSVLVADKTVESFRSCLMKCGALPWERKLSLVRTKTAS